MSTETTICGHCKKAGGTKELHSCPFQEEIHDNYLESCNCCEECVHECLMDI